jgi:hypothetical protein
METDAFPRNQIPSKTAYSTNSYTKYFKAVKIPQVISHGKTD